MKTLVCICIHMCRYSYITYVPLLEFWDRPLNCQSSILQYPIVPHEQQYVLVAYHPTYTYIDSL